jgi:hypothetical protein
MDPLHTRTRAVAKVTVQSSEAKHHNKHIQANVYCGSITDIDARFVNVRFTPESGH